MESLVFAINSVAPIIILVALGYFLKKSKIIGKEFTVSGNRFIFKILFPVMLFTNVYKIENIKGFSFGYIAFAAVMCFIVFLAAIFSSGFITRDGKKRGALIQGIFRSNYALIGIPVASSLFGTEGVAAAAVLSAFIIPLLNILAVTELLTFCGNGKKAEVKKILLGIAKNPLIDGVVAGFLVLLIREIFVANEISFRLFDIVPIAKTADYLSSITTPISLIILGADFEFSAIASLKKEIFFGTVMRCAAVPVFCLGTAFLLFGDNFSGAQFAAIAALFTAPVAVSSVPMAQEMGADTTLAGQLVIWTTVFSAISIFVASFLLKTAGIF